jgi:hypothetical protein
LYFTDADDPGEVQLLLRKWQRSLMVKRAIASLMTKPWEEMTLDEAMREGLENHYRQLATLLHVENYLEAEPQMKGKMDSARCALEAKLAGSAGKMDPINQFFADVRDGRVKLVGAGLPMLRAQ